MTLSKKQINQFMLRTLMHIPILRDFYNLHRLMVSLSNLRTPFHINHFKDIHQIVLSKNWAEKNMNNLMLMTYYATIGDLNMRNELRSREFKIHSQNGEDGVLLYILSKIGIKNRVSVNLGCGGYSSNTANLMINFGWGGLEIDGSDKSIQQTKQFLVDNIGHELKNIYFKQCWITKENINDIIEQTGITGEIDLLSIDIDGNDYWIWEGIDVIKPSVVIIEYNASFGLERSLSVKYDPQFDISNHPTRWYHGASLTALTKLGKRKGYSLIGCESNGVNAFFVRNDLMQQGNFCEATPVEAFYSHFQRKMTPDEQFNMIKDLEYVTI